MSVKKRTLAKTHKAAIIFIAALIVILAVILGFVRYWWTTIDTYKDIDGTIYNVRRNGDSYALYDAKGNILPTTVEDDKVCYVTETGTIVMMGDDGVFDLFVDHEVIEG